MKFFTIIFLFFQTLFVSAQEIEIEFLKEVALNADTFIGIDNFENYYFIKNNTLYKKTSQYTYTYTNTLLGKITSVDITNPLKILLFYKNFNTVLFLDDKLNELTTSINFTSESFSQQMTFVNISSNNNLWLYSLDNNLLQLWNHQTKKVQFTSQPLSSYSDNFKTIQQLSSYKNCWLIGENAVLKFNEYGTFLESFPIDNYTHLKLFLESFIYIKDHKLYYQDTVINLQHTSIKKELIIKNYSINTDHIYIFDGTKIFVFKILKK
jgi:hypothetical protein